MLTLSITGMIDSVQYWDGSKVTRVDSFEAGDVVSKLLRIGPTLVMRINSANRAKIVLRRNRVELIHGELGGTFCDGQPIKCDRCDDSATHGAHGAIAAARALNSIGKTEFELNLPAMARCLLNRNYFGHTKILVVTRELHSE